LKVSLLWVGKTKDRRLEGLIGEYVEKIGRYCRIEIIEVKDAGAASGGPDRRVQAEGKRVLKSFRRGASVIALDERGREMTSREFAAFFGRILEGTPAGIMLLLGGPFGLSGDVREAAHHICSLSRMTLTHEMARLVALDQVYRAFTILRGEGYHH
jgi:23S rRNA (pseudouridine1915-N3)-methyltransferase